MSNSSSNNQPANGTAPAKRRKKKHKRRMFNGMRPIPFVLLSIVLIGATTMAICGMAFALYVHKYINPTVDINLDDFRLNFTSFVTYIDKNGNEQTLEELHGSENRIWADIDETPLNLQHAFVAIEDNRFYTHNGVDWTRSIGAAMNYVVKFRDNFGGGSTITQQLIKNLTGDDETSVKRKVAEIMRALELDKKYDKDDILEMYMNTIYLGQGANGVKAAAQTYFGKDPIDLSLAECAAIAGITKNPYKYDPIRFPEFNKERRYLVLEQMQKYGYISEEEMNAAKAEELQLRQDTQEKEDEQVWSYFVDEVFNSVVEDLMEQKGYSKEVAKQMIYTGGLRIVSTLDPEVQAQMDAVFEDVDNLPGVLGKDGTMPQCSMVIMGQEGEVKALYGGRGQKEGNLVLNRATRTRRSPGSSIKPISVYAPAIEMGLITPISVLDDVPKDFSVKSGGWPKNSTNGRVWQGRMTVKKAVEVSNNTIPVGLVQQMGAETAFDFAYNNMGLKSLEKGRNVQDRKGNSKYVSDVALSPMALGGLTDGVTVEEMTAAYAAFGAGGMYYKPRVYSKVYDSQGNVILDNTAAGTAAMTEKTADYMLDLLINVVTGSQGTGARAKIKGIETAGKTGTTDDDYDRWFAGLTPYYTGVVWFGYDTPQVVKGVSTNPALAIWKSVMERVHEPLENKSFTRNTEMVNVSYCMDSGLRATEACQSDPRGSRVVSGRVAKSDVPKESCNVHEMAQIDGTTGMLANEYCPEAELKNVGMLRIDRSFPIPGVVVSDAQYVLPGSDSSGYPAASNAENPANQTCTVHNAENDGNKPPEEEEPEDPENPGGPEDPDQPTPPGEPGDNDPDEPGDEGGGESQGGSPGGDNKPDPLPPEEGDPSNEGKPAA